MVLLFLKALTINSNPKFEIPVYQLNLKVLAQNWHICTIFWGIYKCAISSHHSRQVPVPVIHPDWT